MHPRPPAIRRARRTGRPRQTGRGRMRRTPAARRARSAGGANRLAGVAGGCFAGSGFSQRGTRLAGGWRRCGDCRRGRAQPEPAEIGGVLGDGRWRGALVAIHDAALHRRLGRLLGGDPPARPDAPPWPAAPTAGSPGAVGMGTSRLSSNAPVGIPGGGPIAPRRAPAQPRREAAARDAAPAEAAHRPAPRAPAGARAAEGEAPGAAAARARRAPGTARPPPRGPRANDACRSLRSSASRSAVPVLSGAATAREEFLTSGALVGPGRP